MTPQDQSATLSRENGIVWLESPQDHEYVREVFYPCDSPDGPTIYEGCRQELGKPGTPGERRVIGWATLPEDAPPLPHYATPAWARRVFYLKEYDRSNEPGAYVCNKPREGVDPLTVAQGKLGEHNDRAWGYKGEEGKQ